MTREDRRRIVLGDKAVANAVADGMPESAKFDAVGDARRQPLPYGGSRDEPELVRHQLDDVSGAESAAMDDRAEMSKNGSRAVEGSLVPTSKECELAVSRIVHRSSNRGVDNGHPLRRFRGQPEYKLVSVCGQVDPEATGFQAL